jgi:hypothetical protein
LGAFKGQEDRKLIRVSKTGRLGGQRPEQVEHALRQAAHSEHRNHPTGWRLWLAQSFIIWPGQAALRQQRQAHFRVAALEQLDVARRVGAHAARGEQRDRPLLRELRERGQQRGQPLLVAQLAREAAVAGVSNAPEAGFVLRALDRAMAGVSWLAAAPRTIANLVSSNDALVDRFGGRLPALAKFRDAVARIELGKLDCLQLGNLDARRDWGFAGDYVEGMWRMLQQPQPDTYVLATGRTQSVRDFVDMAFRAVGKTLEWRGAAEFERGLCTRTGRELVAVNPEFYRPAEVDLLIGDASRAREVLGWEPVVTLEELCAMMVKADLARVERGVSF